MKSQVGIGKLIGSLLLVVGAIGLTRSAIAAATQQTASSTISTPLPPVKLPPQDWHPEIIVRVHNYARVDNGLLLSAEAVATSILREAKVEASWVYCPLSEEEDDRYPRCPANWGTNAFVLNILTPEMVARIQTHVENLGSAPAPCNEDATSCPISVFYFRVAGQAEQFSIRPERLLGHVLAHEVGHMLGANHSSKGVMRGEWGRDDLKLMGFSILEFSIDQAKQLRATLSRRAAQQEASSGFSQSHAVPSSEPTHEASPGHLEIPFQEYRGYLIVVQGSLGDTQRLNFIIDTGTDPSVIDSRIAQKLHMAGVVGKLAVHDQVVDVQQAVLPSVQIGTLRAESLPVLIRDLGFLEKDLGIRIDAVIGLDVLSLSNFSINYTTKRIVFGATPVSGFSVPLQGTPPWLIVRMAVDGLSIDLVLDTAASGILLFQSRIRDRLPQLISLGDRKSSNMGGDIRLQRVLLATTKFGETDFGQQNAFVVEDQEDESREFDGLLGPSALGLKQIAFDFQRHTFSWKK